MAPNYQDDARENLPEVNPQQYQGYAYAVADTSAQSPPSSQPDVKAYYSPHVEEYGRAQQPRQGWKRWWILALIGLFIALISGLVVGGFIGQSIEKGLEAGKAARSTTQSNAPAVSPSSLPSSNPSPTSSVAGSSATATPAPDSNVIGTLVVPKTGCDFPNSRDRKRVSNLTAFSRKAYTTICNSGWGGRADDIVALYTLTPSDCVEACLQFNGDPSNTRECIGGGFIPSWVDQTAAQKALNGPPLNCYLKSGNSGIGANDREDVGTEIVALCLDGKCNGIGSG